MKRRIGKKPRDTKMPNLQSPYIKISAEANLGFLNGRDLIGMKEKA